MVLGKLVVFFEPTWYSQEQIYLYLVKEKRKNKLKKTGLFIFCIKREFKVNPKLLDKNLSGQQFDIIILTNKYYDLSNLLEILNLMLKEKWLFHSLMVWSTLIFWIRNLVRNKYLEGQHMYRLQLMMMVQSNKLLQVLVWNLSQEPRKISILQKVSMKPVNRLTLNVIFLIT